MEKRGIIHSQRDENGYRFFEGEELTKLGEIRSLERLGFSLAEAQELLNADFGRMKKKLQEKEIEVDKQLRDIRYYYASLSSPSIVHHEMNEENCRININEGIYWCPLWEDVNDMNSLPQPVKEEMQAIDISWLAAMPYMKYCARITLSDPERIPVRGNSIGLAEAEREKVLITSLVEKMQSGRCLEFDTDNSDFKEVTEKALAWIQMNGLRTDGYIYIRIVANVFFEEEGTGLLHYIIPLKD